MTNKQELSSPYFFLRPQIPIKEAFDLMRDEGASSAPVIADDGSVIGTLAESDIIKMFISADSGGLEGTVVADFMTKGVITEKLDSDTGKLNWHLLNHHFRQIPITVNGKITGVVSRKDLIRQMIGLGR